MATRIKERVTYTHSGQSYVLGYTPDYVGIWQRNGPEDPVYRFPKNEEGWRAGHEEFARLEPASQEIAPAPYRTAPSPPAPPGTVQAVPTATSGLAIAALVVAVASGVVMWVWSAIIGLLGTVVAAILAGIARGQIRRSAGRLGGGWAAVTASVIAGIDIAVFVLMFFLIASRS